MHFINKESFMRVKEFWRFLKYWGSKISLFEPFVWISGAFAGVAFYAMGMVNSIPLRSEVMQRDEQIKVELLQEMDRRSALQAQREINTTEKIQKIEITTEKIDQRTFDMARYIGVPEREKR